MLLGAAQVDVRLYVEDELHRQHKRHECRAQGKMARASPTPSTCPNSKAFLQSGSHFAGLAFGILKSFP